MKKRFFFLLLIIFHLLIKQGNSLENKIVLKINNKIITTFDVNQEEKYLTVLNQNLEKVDRNKIKILATDSIVTEKIKEIELVKYYQIDTALDDPNLEEIIRSLYQTIGFQNEKEFNNYLETKNLEFELVKKNYLLKCCGII